MTNTELLRAHNAKIKARSKPLGLAIARVFARYRDSLIKQVRTGRVTLRKMTDAEFEQELLDVLKTYGLRHLNTTGKARALAEGGEWIIKPELLERIIADKEMRVKIIGKSIREAVNETIRDILDKAAQQDIAPTRGGLAQAIRDGVNNTFEITPQRAMLIARTESLTTEATANYEAREGLVRPGYVKRKKWLSRPNDGRSGKREHWRMNGKVVDFDQPFVTPLGNAMEYPGDPDAPPGEICNCRCNWITVWRKEK